MVLPCETPEILAANWCAAPAAPAPSSGHVHLWGVVLDELITPELPARLALLSLDERRRASRIRRPLQQQRFIVGRSVLRQLLAGYLDQSPASLSFSYNGMGKPHLMQAAAAGLSFNLAHSGSLAVYAIACDAAVGVDVEAINPHRRLADLAQRFFTPREWGAMALLDADQQVQAFYRIWTQKEAYVKANGDGLLAQIDQFDVAVSPDAQPGLQDHRLDPREVGRWRFMSPTGLNGFAATLATDQPCRQLHYLRYIA